MSRRPALYSSLATLIDRLVLSPEQVQEWADTREEENRQCPNDFGRLVAKLPLYEIDQGKDRQNQGYGINRENANFTGATEPKCNYGCHLLS